MFRGSVKGTGYPLHSPVFPFTSPPVRHRVPSHFNWTLLIVTGTQPAPYPRTLGEIFFFFLFASGKLVRARFALGGTFVRSFLL